MMTSMVVPVMVKTMDAQQYRRLYPFRYPERSWPDRVQTSPPIWCSVDLRDGNQALIEPMGTERKRRMFKLLRAIGFNQIEVGFPSASRTDFDFMRTLVDENLLDQSFEIQVLTQARPELISRTIDSLQGCPRAIVHLYNSTSPRQREWVFGKSRAEIVRLAVDGAKMICDHIGKLQDTHVRYQYSPESFTQTEMPFALEICEAVLDVFKPTEDHKAIINLPATVEVEGANVYADQINWFCDHISCREKIDLSLHTHNDRGQGIAANELAILAGANRIEGTLFGNGERTGNADLVTLALNLYTHGIDPGLDFSNMPEIVKTVEYCNRMPVPDRHPYAGKLVYTAFSGSHQDAIRKSLAAHQNTNQPLWDIPYLPINPEDLGCTYEEVIRINSQSGKGGVSFVLETDYGYRLPRAFQIQLSTAVQNLADHSGTEIPGDQIFALFQQHFIVRQPIRLVGHHSPGSGQNTANSRSLYADLIVNDQPITIHGEGTGPLEAFVIALERYSGKSLSIKDYSEHAVGQGSDAEAVSYITLDVDGAIELGIGLNRDTTVASFLAILSAFNKSTAGRENS